ncbi:MAG: peptidyl-prolyl cis-trans isomerase [Nitrospirota bacterium]
MPNNRITHGMAPVLLLGLLFVNCTRREEPKQSTPSPAAAPAIKILATVNGDPITLADLQDRFARAGLKPEKEAEFQVKEEFLNRLIERKMMLREAQRRRIKVGLPEINQRIEAMRTEPGKDVKETLGGMGIDYEKWKSDIWEDMMIEKLLARDVIRNAHVSAAEVRRYYNENPQEFERPEQVRVRQIVTATEDEARVVLDQLQNEKADFATLARQKSTAPEAEEGGSLGYFAMGEMPGEFNVVFGLPKGGISGVVKSPYGYHIFKLEEKRRAGRAGLEEVSRTIAEKLSRQKQDVRYKQWLGELRGRTKFVVNYQGLRQ